MATIFAYCLVAELQFPVQVLFAVAAYKLPDDFSPDNTEADWTAKFAIDQPGVTLQWQFAFAAYSSFVAQPADLAALKPQAVANTMAAGTPMVPTFNADVLAGGRNLDTNHGFNQYTGDYCNHVVLPNLCAKVAE